MDLNIIGKKQKTIEVKDLLIYFPEDGCYVYLS